MQAIMFRTENIDSSENRYLDDDGWEELDNYVESRHSSSESSQSAYANTTQAITVDDVLASLGQESDSLSALTTTLQQMLKEVQQRMRMEA